VFYLVTSTDPDSISDKLQVFFEKNEQYLYYSMVLSRCDLQDFNRQLGDFISCTSKLTIIYFGLEITELNQDFGGAGKVPIQMLMDIIQSYSVPVDFILNSKYLIR